MEREISIILKVKGAAQAKKAVEDVFNQQTTTLVKGFNQATAKTGTNMQRVAKTSKQASTGVQSFTKTLGRSLSILYLYNRAWATFGSQFEEGLQLERASDQFERNVGSVTKMLPELRTATRGVVSDFDLLRVAGRAVQQGIKSTNLPQTFKLATVAAQKLNMSATDAISTITQALTRQDEGALNSLGIITNVNQAYKTQSALIAKNGGVMSQAMSIQLRQSLIMKELQNRFGGANQAQADGLQVLERFRASWKNFRAEIGQTIGHAILPLTRALTTVLDITTGLLNRMNNTGGFQRFVQLAGALATIFAGAKFIGGIRTVMSLFGMFSGKGGLKAPKSLSVINNLFTKLGAVVLRVFPSVRNFLASLSFIAPRLAGALAFVPGWGTAITAITLLIGPLVKILGKAWTAAKVFFQLLTNFDENSGMSKVLKKDADELGSMYNLIENVAKISLEVWAVLKGLGRGLSDAFSPIGSVISFAIDKVEDFSDWLFQVDKIAVRSQNRLDRITDSVAKFTKWIGLAASAIAVFIPGFQAIGATGLVTFGTAIAKDLGVGEALSNAWSSPIQTQAKPNGPQPQMSTQVSSPEPRAMNLDYANDSSELLRKMSKQLEAQTGIMETDAQKQDIRESQSAAKSNIWTRR